MGFPDALKLVLNGAKVERTSWLGSRGSYVDFDENATLIKRHFGEHSIAWTPTQADMQAYDWELCR